jgi:hypothetical protein
MTLARRQLLHLAAGAAPVPAVSWTAWAETYPDRYVRFVVPFPPGGSTDPVARVLANRLSKQLSRARDQTRHRERLETPLHQSRSHSVILWLALANLPRLIVDGLSLCHFAQLPETRLAPVPMHRSQLAYCFCPSLCPQRLTMAAGRPRATPSIEGEKPRRSGRG